MKGPLTEFQSIIVLVLLAVFVAALFQFKNQFELYRLTKNSSQRKLCLAGASFTLLMVVSYTATLVLYASELREGMPRGRLPPGQWPIIFSISSVLSYAVSYPALVFIATASLQRYHRLCSVKEGSIYFRIAQNGVYVASVIGIMCNTISIFISSSLVFAIILALSLCFLLGVDFFANYSVFYRLIF
jgi:hypothetical protein